VDVGVKRLWNGDEIPCSPVYICLPQLVAGALRTIRAAQVLFRTFCCRSSI